MGAEAGVGARVYPGLELKLLSFKCLLSIYFLSYEDVDFIPFISNSRIQIFTAA